MVRTMSPGISPAAKKAEEQFRSVVRLAGIERGEKSHQYIYKGVMYRVHAYADDALCAEYGGKVRVMRLLRQSALIMHLSRKEQKFLDPVDSAFEEIAVHFPLLTSYVKAAQVKGCFGTSIRWDS